MGIITCVTSMNLGVKSAIIALAIYFVGWIIMVSLVHRHKN